VVIRSLAHLLQKRLRATDVIGRYGGEEFAVILPDTDLNAAFEIIDKLRANFEKITHYHEGRVFNAHFSAGIATTPPCSSTQSLIDNADQALYLAKHEGRNRVIIASQRVE
jgi:diguanylate cyclase (GGDEF)-like protein